MHIVTILLLGAATNLDNLLVGLSIGTQDKWITPLANLVIALCAAILSGAFAHIGQLGMGWGRWPNLLGGGLLLVLGVMPLARRSLRRKRGRNHPPHKSEERQERPHTRLIGAQETIVLSGILGANSIGAALGAGMTGVHPIALAASIALFSFLTVGIGNRIGRRTSIQIGGDVMETLSSIVMIAVGLWEMIL